MKLLIYLAFLMIIFTDSNGSLKTCYGNDCYLCGCEEEKSYIKMSCPENQVLQIEYLDNNLKEGYIDSDECPIDNYSKCNQLTSSTLSDQDRLEVYKNCTYKNSCKVNIKEGIEPGKQRLVNYPYLCHDKSSILDISKKIEQKYIGFPRFYFSGDKFKGQKIDCNCSISSTQKFDLLFSFIHLKPRTCSSLKFETARLFSCAELKDTVVLNLYHSNNGPNITLKIRGMEPDEEDVLFLQVQSNVDVSCSGCINSTVDDPKSADQNQYTTIVTLCGVLAAFILINIVGISLYCFRSRCKKHQKTPDTLANSCQLPTEIEEQSHYDYIGTTQSQCDDIESNVDRPNNQYLELISDSGNGSISYDNANVELGAEQLDTCDRADITVDGTYLTPCSDGADIEDVNAYNRNITMDEAQTDACKTADITDDGTNPITCSTSTCDRAGIEDVNAYNRNVTMDVEQTSTCDTANIKDVNNTILKPCITDVCDTINVNATMTETQTRKRDRTDITDGNAYHRNMKIDEAQTDACKTADITDDGTYPTPCITSTCDTVNTEDAYNRSVTLNEAQSSTCDAVNSEEEDTYM